MRILICFLPLIVAAAPIADTPPDTAVGKCPNAKSSEIKRDKPVTAHPLSQEPGARQEIAVLHYDANRCVTPIVVHDNIGGKSK